MTVGSVGGIGIAMGGGGSIAAGGASGVSASGELPQLANGGISLSDGGVILPNSTPAGIAALAELLEGFSMTEIILALLFLAASRDKDDSSAGSDGLLAGLALAEAAVDR